MYMMLPKERRRNITGIIYAEDAMKATGRGMDEPHGENWYDDLLSYMASLHVPCAVSPIHEDLYDLEDVTKWVERHADDNGVLSDDDLKRCPKIGDKHPAHAHIMFCYKGAKTRDIMTDTMEGYCPVRETIWQKVEDVDSLLRYFAHLDIPEQDRAKKQVYDVRDVYVFGGLDASALDKTTAVKKNEATWNITQVIFKEKFRHYSQLVRWAHGTHDLETWSTVTGRAAYFAALFRGMADERAEEEARKKRKEEAMKLAMEGGKGNG